MRAELSIDAILTACDIADAIRAAMPEQTATLSPIIDRLHRELEAAHQREQRLSLVDRLRAQRAQRAQRAPRNAVTVGAAESPPPPSPSATVHFQCG